MICCDKTKEKALIYLKSRLFDAVAGLVRETGLEPVRSPTRPSNVRVCLFRHSRMSAWNVVNYNTVPSNCQAFFNEMPRFYERILFYCPVCVSIGTVCSFNRNIICSNSPLLHIFIFRRRGDNWCYRLCKGRIERLSCCIFFFRFSLFE